MPLGPCTRQGPVPDQVAIKLRVGKRDPELRDWLWRHPGVAPKLFRTLLREYVRTHPGEVPSAQPVQVAPLELTPAPAPAAHHPADAGSMSAKPNPVQLAAPAAATAGSEGAGGGSTAPIEPQGVHVPTADEIRRMTNEERAKAAHRLVTMGVGTRRQ